MNKLLQIESPLPAPSGRSTAGALWRLGFRPFYLLGAIYAALGVPLWIAVFSGWLAPPDGVSPTAWHAHEMVFGFAIAIVTGFLFTAVRNWTDRPTPTGARLAGLCMVWILARVLFVAGAPDAGVVVELAFLALVALSLLSALLRARNRRNYFVGGLFLVLCLAELAFWAAAHGRLGAVGPEAAIRFALDLVVMLTFVIAGRVVPMFTLNAVRGLRQYKDVRLDRAAIAAGGIAFALELAGADGLPLASAALLAAVLHGARLAGWRPLATFGKPILWILHASYAWVVIGFGLMAAAALGAVPRPLATHAFAAGVVGGLVIGMITRTALGHTGRMLVAGRAEVTMYSLVMLAAGVRVFGPLAWPALYVPWLVLSSVAWSGAFLLYAVVYWPRLSQPRIDGRDG